MSEFSDFILRHEDDDTDRLLLSKGKFPGIDIRLAVNTILSRRKIKGKVPLFHSNPELIYPSTLSAEQCSCEFAARCKAMIVSELAGCDRKPRIADLTGGLGVDCAAFAEIAKQVLYNEMNTDLAEAARHNFAALGIENITIRNALVVPSADISGSLDNVGQTGGYADSKQEVRKNTDGKRQVKNQSESPLAICTVSELLRSFRPDVIFLDPARRAADGKKVFLIEDCKPDILTLKDELLQEARYILVKLSPMADIDMVISRLGRHCRIAEAVSVRGECKELIIVLDREFDGECQIRANCSGSRFCFTRSEEFQAEAVYLTSDATKCEGKLLLEPDKALMKAAPFKSLCSRLGLLKLEKSTHYYITGLEDGFPDYVKEWEDGSPHYIKEQDNFSLHYDGSLQFANDPNSGTLHYPSGLFKEFTILKVFPMDKNSLKIAAREYPNAEVTARNIPIDSGTLRKKLGTSPSDDFHIFALKTLFGNRLFICKRA